MKLQDVNVITAIINTQINKASRAHCPFFHFLNFHLGVTLRLIGCDFKTSVLLGEDHLSPPFTQPLKPRLPTPSLHLWPQEHSLMSWLVSMGSVSSAPGSLEFSGHSGNPAADSPPLLFLFMTDSLSPAQAMVRPSILQQWAGLAGGRQRNGSVGPKVPGP